MPEIVLPASLSERIAQAEYQSASDADLPEGVNFEDERGHADATLADAPQPGYEQGTASVGPADTPPASAAPAGPTPVDPAVQQELLQLRQQVEGMQFQERMRQLQQAEVDFANSIAHLPAAQQEAALARHEAEQLQPVLHYQQNMIQSLQEQLQGGQANADQANEMVAKRIVAWHRATQAGLDPSNPLIFETLTHPDVQTPKQMNARIQQFTQLGVGGRGRIIAGGDRATNAGQRQPKKGSGDLMGLITGRSYEVVPAE